MSLALLSFVVVSSALGLMACEGDRLKDGKGSRRELSGTVTDSVQLARGTAAFLALERNRLLSQRAALDRSEEAWQGATRPIRSKTDR